MCQCCFFQANTTPTGTVATTSTPVDATASTPTGTGTTISTPAAKEGQHIKTKTYRGYYELFQVF